MKKNNKVFLWVILTIVVIAVAIAVINIVRIVDYTRSNYSGALRTAEDSTYEVYSTLNESDFKVTSYSSEWVNNDVTVSLRDTARGRAEIKYFWTITKSSDIPSSYYGYKTRDWYGVFGCDC